MLLDLKRFYGEAGGHLGVMADARFQAQAQTIGEYLIHQGYSKDFAELHLLPMAAAIWSSSTNQIRQFPAESFIRFYQNHGLLNILAQFTNCMHGRAMAVARQARGEAFSSSSRWNHRR